MTGGLSERVHSLEDQAGSLTGRGGYSNASPARRARRRRREQWRTKRASPAETQLRKLEEMLRNQPGVHIRNPSHINPPFRSWPIVVDTRAVFGTAAGSTSMGAVLFRGRVQVPRGHLGVVTCAHVATYHAADAPPAAAMLDPAATMSWDLRLNAQSLDGYTARVPSAYAQNKDAGLTHANAWFPVLSDYLPPIHLRPGDALEFFGTRLVDDTVIVRVMLAGWIYPTRQDAPGILGTVVD